MKQQGHAIIGDPIKVARYTNDWLQVKLHPIIFYRRYELFSKGFEKIKGFYTEIDFGQHISIRFSDKIDMTNFYRLHHEYI